jgi:hypothetical protein
VNEAKTLICCLKMISEMHRGGEVEERLTAREKGEPAPGGKDGELVQHYPLH